MRRRFECVMPDIATSVRPLGEPNYKKYLIFASFQEALQNVEKKFDERNIVYRQINGKSKQIKEIADAYNLPADDPKSINILLINGAKHCSGLNLQNTTDIIFMHRVLDRGTESQLIGRGVRIGRHNDLNVHWLLYTDSETAPV
jgi:SNF2 family DNA or RNA helicase